jgi:hypothetical protein
MKKIFTLLMVAFITLLSVATFAQKINGQWRGYFDSKGDIVLNSNNNTEYVLELEITGSEVSGYSYSYFQNRKYYVICRLDGIYYKNSKSIKVTEVERVKGNTPPDFGDCLQTHFLTYEKDGTVEQMSGKWQPAPNQKGNCGSGTTLLIRRTLSKDLASFKAATKEKSIETAKVEKKSAVLNGLSNKIKPPALSKPEITKSKTPSAKNNNTVAKNNPTAPVKKPVSPSILPVPPVAKADISLIPTPKEVKPSIKKLDDLPIKSDIAFEKRKTDLLKTIQIENETFTVTLYDNGDVDGDMVSLFYNGKLILSNKMLSEKPITLTLDATTDNAINELTMYAENLGEIPPNTALMVVMDGEKRYEVRISSDLKNSGTIHFIHQPKVQ